MQVAAHNLGVILRKLFGVGTPRGWGSSASAMRSLFAALCDLLTRFWTEIVDVCRSFSRIEGGDCGAETRGPSELRFTPSSTG